METLEIEYTDVGEDFLKARMPVTSKVHQPDGVLHGGATAALAESVGSAAVFVLNKDPNAQVRGIEITVNHLKSVASGFVYATARPLHRSWSIGKSALPGAHLQTASSRFSRAQGRRLPGN